MDGGGVDELTVCVLKRRVIVESIEGFVGGIPCTSVRRAHERDTKGIRHSSPFLRVGHCPGQERCLGVEEYDSRAG